MLYLIHFEVRQPDGSSLSELQDIWYRELVAREPHGPGIVQSFKAMGRRTIFVVADFPDEGALDEALARLPIVEEFGSAVEIEHIPPWPFDDPGGPGQTLARPAEEPAQPGVPGRASIEPEEVIRPEQTDEEPEQVPEPEEPARPAVPERTPTKPAGKLPVAEASIDREAPPREEPLAVEPGQPEDVSATGLIRTLDAPRQAPTDQDAPQEEAPVTGVLRSLDALEQDPAAVKPGALSGTRISLQVQSGSSSGEVFEVVGRAGATIGRSPDNSIQLSGDSKISRRHVRIEFKDGDHWLTDLGSSYGTFVNQARLNAPRQLRSGDVIEVGATRMTVSLVVEPAE